MPELVLQVAKLTGIYRHTGTSETIFMLPGQELPFRDSVEGEWQFWKEDNIQENDAIGVLVGKGIFHAIVMDVLPEVGQELNIKASDDLGLETGKHRIIEVKGDVKWQGRSFIHVMTERVGEFDENLPIHHASGPLNC